MEAVGTSQVWKHNHWTNTGEMEMVWTSTRHKELKLVDLRNTSKMETKKGDCQNHWWCEPRRHTMGYFLGTVLSNNDSQPGTILLPRGQVAMPGDTLGYLNM